MEDSIELLSDSSNSSKTVDVDSDEICKVLSGTSSNPVRDKKFYELDLSDDDFIYEPVESGSDKRPDRVWTNKFSADDFCENSNDLDDVLNKISQAESGSISNTVKSKEVERLFSSKSSSDDENVEINRLNFQYDVEKQSEVKSNLEPAKNRRKRTASDKEALQREKELKKAEKIKEKEEKKRQKEHDKAMKNALKVMETCIKPDQCAQYITVNIGEDLSRKSYSKAITAALTTGGYKYDICTQPVSSGITWTRKVPTLINGMPDSVVQNEKYFLLILDAAEFLNLVANHILTGHIQSVLALPGIEHVTVAAVNLYKYYSYLKTEQDRDFKAAVLESEQNQSKHHSEFEKLPKVSRKEVSMELAELQVLCKNCYFRSVNSYEELGLFVSGCTKAVAQAPYKDEKARKIQQDDEFFESHNKDCVKVDGHGNGLSRLWSQVLKTFPLASLETSEAIMSVYPTLNSLLKAYETCETVKEKEKLLQDIPIRRAAGPLAAIRKIGPELSRKAYVFFCEENNVEI